MNQYQRDQMFEFLSKCLKALGYDIKTVAKEACFYSNGRATHILIDTEIGQSFVLCYWFEFLTHCPTISLYVSSNSDMSEPINEILVDKESPQFQVPYA